MLTRERKRLILDHLRRDGRLVAKAFAEENGVSEDTIRRDLREMAGEGLLARVHGGALPLQPALPDFMARRAVAGDEKRQLAEQAVRLFQPGSLVFLDGGTSNEAVVAALPKTMALTVATHSPTIAAALEGHPLVEVWLIGGRLYRHSMVAVGAAAAEAIQRLRPDLFLLGVTALHPHHGFTTGDAEEAAIKRLIAAQSRETWVMATAAKLDAASPCQIMPLAAATGVILPPQASPEQDAMLAEIGVRVLRATI